MLTSSAICVLFYSYYSDGDDWSSFCSILLAQSGNEWKLDQESWKSISCSNNFNWHDQANKLLYFKHVERVFINIPMGKVYQLSWSTRQSWSHLNERDERELLLCLRHDYFYDDNNEGTEYFTVLPLIYCTVGYSSRDRTEDVTLCTSTTSEWLMGSAGP